jgi:hypothetical protein
MLKFEIIVTEEEVELSSEGESELLHESRLALEAQALAGLDRDGAPILGKGGKRLDLHETGALWRNIKEAPAEGGLLFEEPYAEAVLTKYKADALNEASQAEIETKLKPTLDTEVKLKGQK